MQTHVENAISELSSAITYIDDADGKNCEFETDHYSSLKNRLNFLFRPIEKCDYQ